MVIGRADSTTARRNLTLLRRQQVERSSVARDSDRMHWGSALEGPVQDSVVGSARSWVMRPRRVRLRFFKKVRLLVDLGVTRST